MKLLIADDHTLFRDALVEYIGRANPEAKVTLARDFYQTKDFLKEDPDHDLIILDMCMPGMDGLNALKYMKDNYPDKPVAIMSGVAEPEDVKAAIKMGARGYFPKTLSGKALLAAILDVVDGEFFIPMDNDGGN